MNPQPQTLAVGHDPFAGAPLAAFMPLTEAQREVWLAAIMEPEANIAYNEGNRLVFTGPLDIPALQSALQTIVDRHESLRGVISPDGRSMAVLTSLAVPLVVEDLRSEPDVAAAMLRIEVAAMTEPFDLDDGPLFRAQLLQLADDRHQLLLTAHHVICDGWSWAVLMAELGRVYSASVRGEPPAAYTAQRYGDYVQIEQGFQRSATGEEHNAYWLQQLQNAPPSVDLPGDKLRPPQRSYGAAQLEVALPVELAVRLRQTSAAAGASLVAAVLAAFSALLHRLTGSSDLVVGLSAAGQTLHDQPRLVGHCVSLLPLRLHPRTEMSFNDLMAETRSVVLDAMDHQGATFGSLIPQLQLVRDESRPLLVSVVFNIDVRDDNVAFEGLGLKYSSLERHADNFELFFNVISDKQNLLLQAIYNADLFSERQMRAHLAAFQALLEAITEDPSRPVGRLPLLGAETRSQLLQAPALTAPRTEPLHHWFARTAALNSERLAVSDGSSRLSYAELDARANRLAHALIAEGVGPEKIVALYLERSVLLAVAVLGILKAGGAYLPIDPATPAERAAHMLADSGAVLVVTESALAAKLPAGQRQIVIDLPEATASQPATAPAVTVAAENLAYVIYTSGSTGQPKGCMLTHANASRLFTSTEAWFHFGPEDVWTLFHSIAFDFSVWEFFGALLHGGHLVVVPMWVAREPESFLALLASEKVTVLNQTPSAFRQLIAVDTDGSTPLALRTVVFGGEALEFQSLKPWFERRGDGRGGRGPQLVNMYGITETTVHVTYRPISMADLEGSAGASLIGVPIPDLSLYVLDPSLQPTPPGVAGEMWVGGAGVARGYLNRPALTAERFIDDPHHAGQRLYKTGDLARWLIGGELEYMGRIDHQVKLRGYRIELGEIESQLNSQPAVASCFVNVVERSAGDSRLVAWIVWRDPQNPATHSELRSHLRKHLPDYMVPQTFVELERMPLTGNGKLDRKALPDPYAQAAVAPTRDPPRGATEQRIATLWQESLGVTSVSRDDRFLDLGGHSLLAVRVMAALQREFAQKLPLKLVMMEPLAQLASRVAAAEGSAPSSAAVAASSSSSTAAAAIAKSTESPASEPVATPRRGWLGKLFGA